jgi:deoxyhypusine synthase
VELSGATLWEEKSCGKVQDACHDMIRIYVDTAIAFPIFALFVITNQKSRKPKNCIKN